MKKIFFFLLLFVISYSVSAQAPSKKCPICGQSIAKCQYKGKHPNKTAQKPAKPKITSSAQDNQSSNNQSSFNEPKTGTINGHDWVNLGLPSGTKWATSNVGADSTNGVGSYFAWGETYPKNDYSLNNLKYYISGTISDDNVHFFKYVIVNKYGKVDRKKELEHGDDPAYFNWGEGWRTPSDAQFTELRTKCKWTWIGNGYKVIGPNGESIFLPVTGFRLGTTTYEDGNDGFGTGQYWSRTLNTKIGYRAYCIQFTPDGIKRLETTARTCGLSVRPVAE